MSSKKVILSILCMLCPIILTIVISVHGKEISNTMRFVYIFISVLLTMLFFVGIFMKKNTLAKMLFVLNALFCVLLSVFTYLKNKEMLSIFYSVVSFKNFILSTGNKGIIIYVLIQMAQVVILPVPAAVIAIAGSVIYGPLLGGIYCSIGVLLGSNLSYLLGRTFGYGLVQWIAGKSNAEKYSSILNNKGRLFLPMAFLLPMFPDDILCLISGMTRMNYLFFLLSTTLTRPIAVICMCYFGGGYVIPFSGWGVYVWIVLAVLMSFFVYFTYKYQSKIENWALSLIKSKKSKKASN